MTKVIKNIALYGGSFDPPHKSHIALIRYLEKLSYIDEVWLMPCGDRTDKKLLLSKDARFNLLKKIFATQSDIKVIDYEI
jgi:nicotinate-nucleotide adenylyltransferase